MDSNIHFDEYINFEKYWLVLKRRWIPATVTLAGVVVGSAIWIYTLPELYRAKATLLIKVNRSAQLTGLNSATGEVEKISNDTNPLETEAQILQSPLVMEKVANVLNRISFGGEFDVKPIVGTDLLEISYTHEDPESAASFVNKSIEFYIEDHTLYNRSETASAREFIDAKLPQVAANVREAEANLRRFKNQNGITDLEQETAASVTSLSNLADRIDEVKVQLEGVNASHDLLQSQLNMSWQEASAVSALSQSLAVQSVLEKLQEVKVTLAQKQNYLSDNAPQIIALKEDEADLSALLDRHIAQTLDKQQQSSIKNINILSLGALKQEQIAKFADLGLQKEELEKQLRGYQNTYEVHQQRLEKLPRLQEKQRELERRVQAADSTYQTLLSRLQETQIAEQQNIGNVRVVSEAEVPQSPINQRKNLMMAGATVLGGLLGVAVAFVKDICDRSIKDTQEIEEIFARNLSGIIPDFNKITPKRQMLLSANSNSSSSQLPVSCMSSSSLREAYQDLQVNLKLLEPRAGNKVFAVTSAVSNEGKSSVSANLAIAEARCDRKILLIDADLRSPVQHKFWQIANDLGLTNIIKQEANWHHAIQNVKPNLDVLTAGSTVKHPFSLLDSPQMKAFIVDSLSSYDRIIIDTPPLVGLADTKIIGKLADGLVFVVRPGVASYSSVSAAKKLLVDKELNVLGVVANAVDLSKEPSSGYAYPDKKYLQAG